MNRQYHKNLLGILGLSAVAAMTATAAAIPSPASAADTNVTQVTDNIVVEVLDVVPSVTITNPANGSEISHYAFNVDFTYRHLESAKGILSYYDENGNLINEQIGLKSLNPGGYTVGGNGDSFFPVDLTNYPAASRYTIYLEGTNPNGQKDTDSIEILYRPLVPENVIPDEETEDPIIQMEYVNPTDVAAIEVTVTDENGNIIKYTDPADGVEKPFVQRFDGPSFDELKLDFLGHGITSSGTYRLELRAFATNGNRIGAPIYVTYTFEGREVPITPDTGSFLSKLNLAREDYILTGVIIFGGAVALVAILLHRKKHSHKN